MSRNSPGVLATLLILGLLALGSSGFRFVDARSVPARAGASPGHRGIAAHSTMFKLAEDTSTDVHVGLGGISGIRDCCSPLLSADPPVREVWDWNNGDPGLYPSIYKGIYFPEDREPDTRFYPGAKPLRWFIRYHPSWIEFTCAAAKVSESKALQAGDAAFAFGEMTYIPLNTVDPAVLAWLEKTFYGPAAASGLYQHLDFDNFQTNNSGSWSGRRCGHYSRSGTWVQQYLGSEHDPKYRADKVTFAKDVQAWLHAHYPDVAFAANVSWHQTYLGQQTRLLSHVDFWFDEQGFTNGNVGAPWTFLDKVWQEKAQAVSDFLAHRDRAWEDVNKEPKSASGITRGEIQWALGNYLLFKNNHSWIDICPVVDCFDETHVLAFPEYRAARVGEPTDSYYANQGVYRRDFTAGMTLVNPSSKDRHTVHIPDHKYWDLYGHRLGKSVTLLPGTAMVLVKRVMTYHGPLP